MMNQIRWHQANANTNPFSYLNFVRWYVHWSNGRQMDRYVGDLLDKRYSEIQEASSKGNGLKSKSVIDLILQTYATSKPGKPPVLLDQEFHTFAIRQIRLFIFVGHDSTSSTICYIIHLLFLHLGKLKLLREELQSTFGGEDVARKILEQQQIVNQLPYTTAVIKEALRMFPPASASREGQPGVSVTNDEGQACPTDGAFVLTLHTEMQRSAKYFPRPDEFLPERFLVPPDHELYPAKNAWRPFEKGPRNCMAEGLVMIELKIVIAIVLSRFDFAHAYDEYDRKQGSSSSKGVATYHGERAYQIEEGAAHPADGYPCKVFYKGSQTA
jgi:cytochrome P450